MEGHCDETDEFEGIREPDLVVESARLDRRCEGYSSCHCVAMGDPRPSLEELYGGHHGYVTAVGNAALRLWSEGLMLFDDVQSTSAEANAQGLDGCWRYFP